MVLTKHIKGSQYNRNKNQYSNGHSHAEYFYIVCDSSLYSNVNIKLYFTVGYGSMCWRWWYSFGGGIVCFLQVQLWRTLTLALSKIPPSQDHSLRLIPKLSAKWQSLLQSPLLQVCCQQISLTSPVPHQVSALCGCVFFIIHTCTALSPQVLLCIFYYTHMHSTITTSATVDWFCTDASRGDVYHLNKSRLYHHQNYTTTANTCCHIQQ